MLEIISPVEAGSLHGLFLERVRRTPDKIAYRYFGKNVWQELNWRQMKYEVARWQTALSHLNLQRGDRVDVTLARGALECEVREVREVLSMPETPPTAEA